MTLWHFHAAVSLDMRIARPDGSVGWLADYPPDAEDFAAFLAEVDLIVMGRSTYEAVLSYGAGAWPYPGKETIVLTSRALDDAPAEVSVRSDLAATVAEIESRGLGRVWIEGGGRLLAGVRALGRLDVMELAVLPVVLGAGVPAPGPDAVEPEPRLGPAVGKGRDALWLVYRRR